MSIKKTDPDHIKQRLELCEPMFKVPEATVDSLLEDDKHPAQRDTHRMNDITREEFNAKLETIETKMDARSESVSLKIDGFLSAQIERDKRIDAALSQISKDHSETKSSISSMKTTLIITALTTVVTIVLGVAGFNTALTSNMLSAFQAGKSEQPAATQASAPVVTPVPSSPPVNVPQKKQ